MEGSEPMSYWKGKNGTGFYFGESDDADRTARWLGLIPVSAPTIPPGSLWTEISPGLSRIDVPQ